MDGNRETILIMEDNTDDAFLLQRALLRAGLGNPVQVAADGDEAVAYLSGEGPYADRVRYPLPSLVLMDLRLPKRSGLEVLEWIRGQAGLRRLRVIVMTSVAEPSGIQRAYDLGANSCLVKPVSLDELVAMMRSVADWWFGRAVSAVLEPEPRPDITDRTGRAPAAV